MTINSILTMILDLSNRWDFCSVAAVVGIAAAFNPWTKHRTAGLGIPLTGLLLRKILLFIPICGALSTSDYIFFWSEKAYIYYLVVLLFHPLFYYITQMRVDSEWSVSEINEISNTVFWISILVLLVGSGILLPIKGWSHVYMPVIAVLGCVKLALVSPVFLPVCWIGIALQTMGVFVSRNRRTHRLNTILVTVVLILAINGFIIQGVQMIPLPGHEPPRLRLEIQNHWQPQEDIKGFFSRWLNKLDDIRQTGLNIVERDIPDGTSAEKNIAQQPGLSLLLTHKNLAAVSIGFVLLILFLVVLSERSRWPGKKQPFTQEQEF